MTAPILPRVVQVMVGPAGAPGLLWSDLYITFSAEKSKGKNPNKGKVEIYNLSEPSLQFLELPGQVIRVLAGQPIPTLVFQGDVSPRNVQTRREPPNLITTIEAGDGRKAFREATFTRSYPPGTSSVLVLADISTAFAAELVVLGYVDPSLVPVTYPTGITFAGKLRSAMDQLGSDLGAEWSIQDGVLTIVREGNPVAGTALVISAATGMRGSPTRTDKGISVTTALTPALGPGKVISVVSTIVTGFYRVTKASHDGDSRGLTWDTKLEAVPL